ncbi:ankyrin repeat-containing domain protein [Coprinopsis sp. MPI-PUGE-AT-0042]|nr:ankyrin repeat-containing domain protein [Coprinopsis sp. MPI-PUGE-AT-0042]
MGASFSTWARWDDTVVQQVLASEAHPIQNSGTAIIQGAQNLTITGGVFNLNNQQAASTPDPERFRKALDFLSLVNFRSIQQENLGKWTPGTIKWLLESSIYQFWLDSQYAILWGTGMPGAGKTVLASVVLEDLQARARASGDTCVAFVYCRYTEPMKVRDILAALVRQLLERFPRLMSVVEPLYSQHNLEGTKPTQSELIHTIRDICGRFRIAYLFIDGLDEALHDEQFDLLDTLKSVPANFFITSRPLVRLKDVLPKVEFFDITAHEGDIELLVSRRIDRNLELRQVLASDGQKKQVIRKISESSQGMFLHASLMVDAISHCTSSRSVMERLEKLPAKLDVLYEEVFKRIEMQPEEHAALAKRVLLWVAYGFRPLTVDDLRYAVASDPKLDWADPDSLVPELLLFSVSCGLVVVETQGLVTVETDELGGITYPPGSQTDRVVRLVHYTALSAVQPGLGLISPPLQNYAYESWHLHASESIQQPARPDARPVASILRFLAICNAFSALESKDDGKQFLFDNFTTPIYLAAYYHLPPLIPLIDPRVNEQTRNGKSALSLAAWRGDAVMVGLLLKLDGVDVNLQGSDGNTSLMHAAGRGWENAVKTLLLDPRVDIHKRNAKGETALQCALLGRSSACTEVEWDCRLTPRVSNGHTEAALLLIETPGIDVNAVDNLGRTPLMVAHGHPVRLLERLAMHPNIDLLKRDDYGLTPLMYACHWGPSSAIKWYTRLPGVDARDNSAASALSHRAQHMWPRVAETEYLSDFQALVDAGLDVNGKDVKGFTALTYAVQAGNPNAIRALLQLEGVDVNSEDHQRRTLLMVACDVRWLYTPEMSMRGGKTHPLYLLLNHPGLNVNAKNKHGTTAMAYAVAKSVLETMTELMASLRTKNVGTVFKCEAVQESRQLLQYCTINNTLCGPMKRFCPREVRELVVHFSHNIDIATSHESAYLVVASNKIDHPDLDFAFGENDSRSLPHADYFPRLPHPDSSPSLSHPDYPSLWQHLEIGHEDHERVLQKMKDLGLGSPWEHAWVSKGHAWISEGYDDCVQLLLNHPDINDNDFGYLRRTFDHSRYLEFDD